MSAMPFKVHSTTAINPDTVLPEESSLQDYVSAMYGKLRHSRGKVFDTHLWRFEDQLNWPLFVHCNGYVPFQQR